MLVSPKRDSTELEINNSEVRTRVYKSAGRKSEYKEEDKKLVARKREFDSPEESSKRYKKYNGLDDLLNFAKHKNLCKSSYKIMITGSIDPIECKKVIYIIIIS